ncbi:uncharacterized protein LAJ45_02526 [Morchella importuna]|uniref:uncharacterized protein n=1 Tax=Morchella importuna TaxID=1174673 RepID=UPI001E8E7847|nr:uncharacterized protein LAJ45_02526 [Morchella importuna]KAH8153713.1 hypothetical protein LAJ45_02526 [Morchella importuna]
MRTSQLLLLLALPSSLCTPLQFDTSSTSPSSSTAQTPLLPNEHVSSPRRDALAAMTTALTTLQSQFFTHSTGTYPTGINWTRAVLGTLLAASTRTLSSSPSPEHRALSNRFFTELIAFYYGQDMHLKQEAYDDILWVVLQWLEALKTIDLRTDRFEPTEWSGSEWTPAFADRAQEFYTIAERGWDEVLCGGGMIWSPWLEPYKNAITNELYISASIGMYLYHPAHNPAHLSNALRAHAWLAASGMRNAHGLYTDGFHISKLKLPPSAGEKTCDRRDEMVYTYNQGVLLSGLRGLAEVTGERAYLEEGFALVDAVVSSQGKVGEIVVGGILTEKCDPESRCSQNGHTFKGIFMHHLTLFCTPLVPLPGAAASNLTVAFSADTINWHREVCSKYNLFLVNNAAAAWRTRNANGVVGAWWGAPDPAGLPNSDSPFWDAQEGRFKTELDAGATDHLNPELPAGVGLANKGDLNDRGRGRTVESHSGGLAALRAVVEVVFA